MGDLETKVLASIDTFVGFARKRLNDPALAADAVQESLLKALRSEARPRDEEKIVSWFYRILRRTIIDFYRERDVRQGVHEKFEIELAAEPSAETERELCQCFRSLIPTLPPQYQVILERIDLNGEAPKEVAADLKIAWNNLNVRLHRARAALRARVEETCQACSKHGCLDCTCGSPDES